MTTGTQTHEPAQLRKARIDVAEQDYRAACEEAVAAALERGVDLNVYVYRGSTAARCDDAARQLAKAHAALERARGAR